MARPGPIRRQIVASVVVPHRHQPLFNFLRDETRRPQSVLIAKATPRGDDGLVSSDEPWWLEPYPDALIDDAAVSPEAPLRLPRVHRTFVHRRPPVPSCPATSGPRPARRARLFRLRGRRDPRDDHNVGEQRPRTRPQWPSTRSESGSRTPPPVGRSKRKFSIDSSTRFENADVDQVVSLLAQDAKLFMPPEPFECHGARAIAEFCQQRAFWGQELSFVRTRVNNQPAFGYYLPDPHSSISRAGGLMVLALGGDKITTLTRFGDKGILARCGLPRTVAMSKLANRGSRAKGEHAKERRDPHTVVDGERRPASTE